MCKFCKQPNHDRNVRECEGFREFRRGVIAEYGRRLQALEDANHTAINDEFSDLPEA